MKAESHSSSEFLAALLFGPARKGTVLSRHDLKFGQYVVTLTTPGAPRMPNGIACRLSVGATARVSIGQGRLTVGNVDVDPGAEWNPFPVFEPLDSLPVGPEPQVSRSGAWNGSPDVLLAGYVAGLVLLHGQRRRAEQLAMRAIAQAEPVGATLLMHAARGEVPEPVHVLLAFRDAGPLVAWSAAGITWLRGLVSAGLQLDAAGVPARGPGLDRRGIA